MSYSIGIALSPHAYLPEAYAYQRHLTKLGWAVELEMPDKLDPEHDIQIHFMGFFPFWNKAPKSRLVLEYHSLSTGRWPKVRNIVKSGLEMEPDARIFLNAKVRSGFPFLRRKPFLYRDMGVDAEFFHLRKVEKVYDVVYSGSLTGRPGLLHAISNLAMKGAKVLVIGAFQDADREALSAVQSVDFVGPKSREELPSLYSKAKYGLNFTPDVYPLKFQTSTKTIEYCAAGLGVISNRYPWVENFFSQRNGRCLWLNDVDQIPENYDSIVVPSVDDLEWDALLERCDFAAFLRSLLTH